MSHGGSGHGHGHGHGDVEAPGHAHSHDAHGKCSGHGHDSHEDHGHSHGGHGHGGHGHGHGKDLTEPLLAAEAKGLDPDEGDKRKLRNAVFFVLFFMCVELVGGVYCHSLAILTDAAHMLSDAGGFIVSYIALELSAMERTNEYSFGFRQAEVIGALLSLAIVWSLTAILLWEAVPKFFNPDPDIDAPVMLGISSIGFVVNVCLMQVLGHGHGDGEDGHGGHGHGHSHGHSHGFGGHDESSVAMDSAIAHVIGDMVQSLGVCLAALCIWLKPFADTVGETESGVSRWNYADPCCTVLFGFMVLYTTKSSAMRIFETLLVRAPRHIDNVKFAEELRRIPNVDSIHDLHVWTMGSKEVLCTCHIMVAGKEYVTPTLKDCITVAQENGIFHSTFQIEILGEFDPAEEVYGFHANELSPQVLDKESYKRPSFKGKSKDGHDHGHAHADGHECDGHGHDGEAHGDSHKGEGHGHDGHGHGGHGHDDGHKCDGHGHDGEGHDHGGKSHDGEAHGHSQKDHGHGHDGHSHADGHKCDDHGHAH